MRLHGPPIGAHPMIFRVLGVVLEPVVRKRPVVGLYMYLLNSLICRTASLANFLFRVNLYIYASAGTFTYMSSSQIEFFRGRLRAQYSI